MSGSRPDRTRPTDLRVRYRSSLNNVPVDSPPRFSWSVDDPTWGNRQCAYRVIVAGSLDDLTERSLLWDSGKVAASSSTDIAYEGPSLSHDTTYYWAVKVWNDDGDESAFSEPADFATAHGDGWTGRWLAHQPASGDSHGYRSRWRSPEESASEWVQVDLGESQTVSAIELYPTEPFSGPRTPDGRTITGSDTEETYYDATVADGPVAFGFPSRYRIEVAEDASFEESRMVVETAPGDPGRDPVIHDVDSVTARYVRIVATDLDEFHGDDRLREEHADWAVFALAALAVRDESGTDLAVDQSVTASSSVESEGWGRTHLTDGEYTAAMTGQSPLFRTEFELTKPVERARAHFVGLGYGELHVNGERIGDAVLDPGWTQYDERVLYSTYDVGEALEEGPNAVGIWLGRGWFGRSARHWSAFGSPRALLEVTVEYTDGTTRTLTTDGDWRTTASPVVENDIYEGETYDARLEQTGWAEPGFDDASWDAADVVAPPKGACYPQQVEPITVTETLEPVEILDGDDGPILDFGQNHTGWLSLDIDGGEPGDEVVLRHAEALDENGALRTVDLRSADATDTYVIGDEEEATYEPRFTYHGFKYAQVSGYPGDLTTEDVRSRVVHTGMETTGEFDCSNDDLNRVQRNAQWGLRSNAHSVPTDCPQRDERMGFTGDGHIAARALHYNFDAVRFHEKWLRDHVDTQSRHGYIPAKCPYGAVPSMADPSWTASMVLVPWHLYRFYGDEGVLERNYEALRRYVDFWDGESEDDLLPERYDGYGDWLALENADGRRGLPTGFFTDAYYYRSVDLLARIADALDVSDHASYYRERADAIAEAFNKRYFDLEAREYEARTQASYALPLFFGIAPERHADEIAANLARKVVEEDDSQLRTGFLGTRPLLAALTEYGYADVAYRVVSQPDFPGWVYMARNGATTMWERWDSDSEDHIGGRMNSLNHSPFTCVSEWFFDALAGIDVNFATESAYPIDIEPAFVDDLSWAEGSVRTPRGMVRSRWEAPDDVPGRELTVELPWNLAARVTLPVDHGTVRLDGEPIWKDSGPVDALPAAVEDVTRGDRAGRVSIGVTPGSHRFSVE